MLTPNFLDRLVKRKAVCILYTHLGKIPCKNEILPRKSRDALGLLAAYESDGKILVTTTRRLLGYCRMIEEATFSVNMYDDHVLVDIAYTGPEQDLAGLTFLPAQTMQIKVSVNGRMCEPLQHNAPTENSNVSFSLPWARLEFPGV